MIRRFNRFELKYLVPAKTRDAIAAELAAQMRPDPEGGAGGAYRVTSLYYDSDDLQFFRSKLEGIKFRRKLRVRRYGPPPSDAAALAMVEIKQRINRTTQKRRLALPLSAALRLCAGEGLAEGERDLEPQDRQVAAEVEFLTRALRLRPTCVIAYQRQAFMGSAYEPGLRVTFDSALSVCEARWAFAEPPERHFFLPPEVFVMEVKANDAVPLWVSHLLARHDVPLRRYSKYCAGLDCLLARTRTPAKVGGGHG